MVWFLLLQFMAIFVCVTAPRVPLSHGTDQTSAGHGRLKWDGKLIGKVSAIEL